MISLAIRINGYQNYEVLKNGFDGISKPCRVNEQMTCAFVLLRKWWPWNQCFCFNVGR